MKTVYAIKEQDKTRTKAQGLEEVLDVELEDGLRDQGAGQDKD